MRFEHEGQTYTTSPSSSWTSAAPENGHASHGATVNGAERLAAMNLSCLMSPVRPDYMMQTAAANFGQIAGTFEPVARALAKTQAEVMTLCSQRAQAYLAWPSRLMSCRTPFDAVTAQMRFWQQAMEQYSTASRGLMNSWNATLPQIAQETTGLRLETSENVWGSGEPTRGTEGSRPYRSGHDTERSRPAAA